jgi:hypothetical protein
MRGSACQYLGTLTDEVKNDFMRLTMSLTRRFNPENQSELYRVQLRNRVRLPDETLPELSQEIRRLVQLAYPAAPNQLIEMLAKDHFVDAVNDGEIRWRIFQSKVQDLDQATAAAVEIETYKKPESQRNHPKKFVRQI